MSKTLPFFKFFPAEWIMGNISYENYSLQGLFITACCHYWHQDCNVNEATLSKILGKRELKKLIVAELVKQEGEQICIDFLDEQYSELSELHKVRVESGRKGGSSRAKAKQKPSPSIKDKEEEIDKDKEEDKIKIKSLFERFWNEYDKKTSSKEKCYKKFAALKPDEMEILFKHVPDYVNSTPDKKFRKDPQTYLNNKSFNDEIIISSGVKAGQPQKVGSIIIPADYTPDRF